MDVADQVDEKMSYVTIGSMRVSSVMCGTMMWGSFVDEEAEAHRQLDAYINAGGNFIDTAELYPVAFNYGRTTETWIGWWLRQRLAEGSIERGATLPASATWPASAAPPGVKKLLHFYTWLAQAQSYTTLRSTLLLPPPPNFYTLHPQNLGVFTRAHGYMCEL